MQVVLYNGRKTCSNSSNSIWFLLYYTVKWNNVFLDAADTANDTDVIESRKSTAETLPAVSSEKPDLKPSNSRL